MTKKRLAIFGSADLALKVTNDALASEEYEIFGYFEDFKPQGFVVNGYKVWGKLDDAINLYEKKAFDCLYIAVGYNHFDLRESIYNRVKGVIPLANIVSKDAFIYDSASLGEGVYIGARTQVGPYCEIEDNVHINGNIILGHNNKICKHSYLSGGDQIAGYTKIGSRCFIGIGVVIADKLEIVDDVWVGLGMVVYKSIKKAGKYAVMQKVIKLD